MVFGDTVAIALMAARNLTKDEYAANHPAGRIGKSLIFKVREFVDFVSRFLFECGFGFGAGRSRDFILSMEYFV